MDGDRFLGGRGGSGIKRILAIRSTDSVVVGRRGGERGGDVNRAEGLKSPLRFAGQQNVCVCVCVCVMREHVR